MLDNILYVIANLFSIFAAISFLDIFLNRRKKNQKIFYLTGIVFWSVNSMCCIVFHMPIINLLTTISGFFLVAIFSYKEKTWKKILAVCSSLAISVLIEDVLVLIWGVAQGNGNYIVNMLTALFLFCLVNIISKVWHFRENTPLPKNYYYCLMLPPILSMIVLVLLTQVQSNIQNTLLMMIGVIFILIINFLMFYFFDQMFAYYNEIWENRFLEEKIAMYENQLDIIRRSKEREHTLQHDLKNHLFLLAKYAKNGRHEEVLPYIEQMERFMTIKEEIVNTGNEPIDAILNYMLEKARKSGADPDIKINIPKTEFCSYFDLNILLTNLLENAIEALDTCPEKILQLVMELDKGILYLKIGNSFDGQIKKDGTEYLTRKTDKRRHGIGLKNVREITEKYEGTLEITQKDNMFYVNVILHTG